MDLSKIKPGVYALVEHWRGPVVKVAKGGARRVYVEPSGYIETGDVRVVFETEADAEAGLQRYRAAWRAAQDELKRYEAARREAASNYYAAERRLKAAAWEAAERVDAS